jgi:hypothetical protein
MAANKKSGSYSLLILEPEGLVISSVRPDSQSLLELNPLAAGISDII